MIDWLCDCGMQRCVLSASFLNNDIEQVSAVLQTVDALAVILWMLQGPAQWAEDEKGNCRKGNKNHDVVPLTVNPSVLKKEDATKNSMCSQILKRNCAKWIRTLLCCLEEQFVTRELFSKAKVKDATFVQKMYFNSLLGDYKGR